MATRFAKQARKLKRRWRYTQDRGRDHWSWGKRVLKWFGFVIEGDCEDYDARLVWWVTGSKRKAIKAIERGDYVFWWATTLGENGRINHAVVECVKTGEFAEVIFGKAVKKTDWSDKHLIGSIYLRKRISAHVVLTKLGVKKPLGVSDR